MSYIYNQVLAKQTTIDGLSYASSAMTATTTGTWSGPTTYTANGKTYDVWTCTGPTTDRLIPGVDYNYGGIFGDTPSAGYYAIRTAGTTGASYPAAVGDAFFLYPGGWDTYPYSYTSAVAGYSDNYIARPQIVTHTQLDGSNYPYIATYANPTGPPAYYNPIRGHLLFAKATWTPSRSGQGFVLLVGGGGSGGYYWGGGGGGGGVIEHSVNFVANQKYQICVGAGGRQQAQVASSAHTGNGANSFITAFVSGSQKPSFYYVAYGGGGGGVHNMTVGANGGCGGGGPITYGYGGWGIQGYAGGTSSGNGSGASAGGGGADGIPANIGSSVTANGGAGGSGKTFWLTNQTYGGGGGGYSGQGTMGSGGTGGGGTAGSTGGNGTANTGGGGGGGGGTGGLGGSGIVVIAVERYRGA